MFKKFYLLYFYGFVQINDDDDDKEKLIRF